MPSVFESVTNLLAQGDTLARMSGALGTNTGNTQRAVELATPTLLSGLADKSGQPGGMADVTRMLDSAERSPLSEVDGMLEDGELLDGENALGREMLDGIFGANQDGVISRLASRAGVNSGVMGGLLPMIVPVVMGAVAKRRSGEQLNEMGVANLLIGERSEMQRNGLLGVKRVSVTATTAAGGEAAAGAGAFGDNAAAANLGADNATAAGAGAARDAELPPRRISTAISDAPKAPRPYEPPPSSFNWLPWLIGAVIVIAIAAWAFVQFGITDSEDLTSPAADLVDGAGDAVTDAGDAATDAAESAGETVAETTDIGEEATADAAEDPQVATSAPVAGSTINELLDLEPITFAVNSAEITAEGQAVLADVVEFMNGNPDVNVEIGGHTDSDGDDAVNLELSQNRADSVMTFLVSEGVAAERMTTAGFGETQPIAGNDTPENKAINRRIEFTIQ